MNNIAVKIRKRRNELQYSQEFMAIQLDISQPAYANIENGETKMNIERLGKIAEILAIDIVELLDTKTTINNIHNNAENTYGIVENLYSDNKEYVDRIIQLLENDKTRFLNVNDELRRIIKNLSKK